MFGRMPPGPSFQSAIPSVTASFGMGAGTAVHPSTVFPGDAYGVSERTKRVFTDFYFNSILVWLLKQLKEWFSILFFLEFSGLSSKLA